VGVRAFAFIERKVALEDANTRLEVSAEFIGWRSDTSDADKSGCDLAELADGESVTTGQVKEARL
jgi:hypothetical protein